MLSASRTYGAPTGSFANLIPRPFLTMRLPYLAFSLKRLRRIEGSFFTRTYSGLTTGGCPSLRARILARFTLGNACRFSTQLAQVIELRPPYVTLLHQVDVIDDRGMQRKDPLDSDAERKREQRHESTDS